MKTKITVQVGNNAQAKAIQTALLDPAFKATAIIVGMLMPFSQKTRERVIGFVIDKLNEERH